MEKILVFDMDGTIADLYNVKGWLEDLRAENPRPYRVAKPIYDMDTLNEILNILKDMGWKIIVTTWLAQNSTKEYKEKVTETKKSWLDRYNFPYDKIHAVKYGTTKANCTRALGGFQILIDDNEKVRKGWHLGDTIDANENIIEKLVDIIEKEYYNR